MATQTTRWLKTDLVTDEGATAVVLNGSGGGAPALEENADFPMANLLVRDRYVSWMTGAAPPNDVYVDFDLTGGPPINKTVNALAICGFRGTALFPNSCFIQYALTAGGYPPTWIGFSPGSISLSLATDSAVILTTPTLCRYVRFWFPNTFGNPFSVGRLMVASTVEDLGFAYSLGAVDTETTQQIRNRAVDGTPVVTRFGKRRRRLSLPYNSIIYGSTGAKLRALARLERPFVMVNPFGETMEVDLADGTVPFVHRFGTATQDIFDVQLELEQLP